MFAFAERLVTVIGRMMEARHIKKEIRREEMETELDKLRIRYIESQLSLKKLRELPIPIGLHWRFRREVEIEKQVQMSSLINGDREYLENKLRKNTRSKKPNKRKIQRFIMDMVRNP